MKKLILLSFLMFSVSTIAANESMTDKGKCLRSKRANNIKAEIAKIDEMLYQNTKSKKKSGVLKKF